MGAAKIRRQRFFDANPFCCFCGGMAIATTIDHIPSRGFFAGRVAPEGYEFPACDSCQSASANYEQLIAFVASFSTEQQSPQRRAKFVAQISAIKNNFPDAFSSFLYPAAAAKRIVREQAIPLPEGMLASEAPLANLNHPDVQEAVRMYVRKLIPALHYHHFRRILPQWGVILYSWYTNVHKMLDKIPTEAVSGLRGMPTIQRQTISLSDQFSYRFGIDSNGTDSAFFVALGDSIAIMAAAIEDPDSQNIDERNRYLRPFKW